MKKIKYLFGLLIFGFGLLINQSFGFGDPTIPGSDLYVEGVTLPWSDSTMQSSIYQYRFNNYGWGYRGRSTSTFSWSRTIDGVSSDYGYSPCSSNLDGYLFNNTSFGTELYNGWITNIFSNSSCVGYSLANTSNGGYDPIKIALGNGNDFGNNFIYVNSLLNDSGIYTPHYGLGGGFLTSNDVVSLTAPNINYYLRLFFRQNGTNLSDPQNTTNFITGHLNSGSIARQYFTQNGFRYQTYSQTSPKTFGDFGGSYTKGIHFGGYGMGYSFVLNTLGENFIRWDDFSFASIGSRCLENLMTIGMSDPNSGTSSGCQQMGLLVLKGDTYVSSSNNASVVVLSKNPSNKSQILYEQFDCAEDDIQRIFDNSYCSSIGHGYIVYNSTGVILPFNDVGVYYIGSGNRFIDLLLGGGYYGYVTIDSNTYCLKSSNSDYCFGLHSTPRELSIKELYLEGSLGGFPSISNPDDITNQMIANCKGPYYNTPDGLPPAYCNNNGTSFSGNCYTQFGVDSSGNIYQELLCVDGDDYINNTNTWVVDSSGNYVSYCSGDCFGNYIYFGELGDNFTSIGNTGYFDTFFNSTGKFFKCPYPYTQKLIVGKKVVSLLNGYDPFVPINCFIASFLAGKNNTLFNSGLYLIDGGPLINSSSDIAILFYHFFDFLLCVGFILLASVLDRFFSR